jgi:hypothetical protein
LLKQKLISTSNYAHLRQQNLMRSTNTSEVF